MAVRDSAEAHWAAVSWATQLEGRRRREARLERSQRRRLRSGLMLVRAGLRLAEPLLVDGLFEARGGGRAAGAAPPPK